MNRRHRFHYYRPYPMNQFVNQVGHPYNTGPNHYPTPANQANHSNGVVLPPPQPEGYNNMWNAHSGQSPYQHQQSEFFQNPLQQEEEYYYPTPRPRPQGFANPYPKGSFAIKNQQGGVNSIMNSFKGKDGSLDLNKMVNTAGQMMGAMNQVSALVKGFGSIFT
ncbi:YppG family protein [Bacillus spongiae]|uniref:YppG family protein n=2 Tax=Bacillus spongiae TaxID=2683610 RepID=A0ABU8HD03_9BACI